MNLSGSVFEENVEMKLKSICNADCDCKDFIVYQGTLYCLTSRNTIFVPSEREEYEFYGEMYRMFAYEHYIYLVFRCSRVFVFDVVCREVVCKMSGRGSRVVKAVVDGSMLYMLCEQGKMHMMSIKDMKCVEDERYDDMSTNRNIIVNFTVYESMILCATASGEILSDGRAVIKVIDGIDGMTLCGEYLYVASGSGRLLKYDVNKWRLVQRIDGAKVDVVGDDFMVIGDAIADLRMMRMIRMPVSIRRMIRTGGEIYMQTQSEIGVWEVIKGS
ncbi:hypothetical protein CWI42_040920 [Ordospora colligata]|uniref:Uncharacterized protein n=1 Tax=Ordospora colligata OC4 TaxID=1354746 RepID=A0A0B2ULI2_9MICR|nr:uncharacterized protein M896_040930 [Ordospora colligata OC4]KHN69897.1 hypothetical protein M896_040930 [Ordospora colligata OC4]TBU16067.1 hypothetical protein CWI41_040920 [Ordospora colligata]TBU18984.1 hypothetical protein CWI42_040920 [Ordospora colligata]